MMSLPLLRSVLERLNLSECEEMSIEVNPATVDENGLKAFKDLGFNRISIGVQALDDVALQTLGRLHTASEALAAVELALKHFDNVSADFIYGRPGQTLPSWEKELRRIIALGLPHVSLYQLTIENGWKAELPQDEEILQMFRLNHNEMTPTYEHYEISNYARPGFECRHNAAYWRLDDYLGIGPSAHSRIAGTAVSYTGDINEWLHHPVPMMEKLSPPEVFTERLLMGLRTKAGLILHHSDYAFLDRDILKDFISRGFLELRQATLSPSFKGMEVSDYLIRSLLR